MLVFISKFISIDKPNCHFERISHCHFERSESRNLNHANITNIGTLANFRGIM